MLRPPSRVRAGLVRPIQIAGVEPKLLMFNVMLALMMLAMLHLWWWIIVTWVIHQAFKAMGRSDASMRLFYIRYANQSDRYEPWPESNPRMGLRPVGAGRGRL